MNVRYSRLYASPYPCCKFQFGFHYEGSGDIDVFWCDNTKSITLQCGGWFRSYGKDDIEAITDYPNTADIGELATCVAWKVLNKLWRENIREYKYKELK